MATPQRQDPPADAEIVAADAAEDIVTVRILFQEYAAAIGGALCFQNFEREVAGLPGDYAAPRGALFLARNATHPLGCVALRPLSESDAELKRLYVRPEARGTGLGRRLAERAIQEARRLGYGVMRLDTLPSMHEAQVLYASLGFRDTAPYNEHPVEGARFLALELTG